MVGAIHSFGTLKLTLKLHSSCLSDARERALGIGRSRGRGGGGLLGAPPSLEHPLQTLKVRKKTVTIQQ